jgi:phosphoglucomutase/phosphomannomutase
MLMAELAALLKRRNQTLHGHLDAIYKRHGYHAEGVMNVFMEGSEGMARMQALMARFRQQPPRSLAGIEVSSMRDYEDLTTVFASGRKQPLQAPRANMVILDLAEPGNYVAVRPSGTEPKVKFYLFAYVPAERLADLEASKTEMAGRLKRIEMEVRGFVDAVGGGGASHGK